MTFKIKDMKKIKSILLLITALIFSCSSFSQNAKPRVSPARSITGKIKDVTVTINYSSPSVKGRKIWGGLVPYDKVWRAGANEATTIETDKDIQLSGNILPAGKYGFFLVPVEKNEWIAVFNKEPNQWGAFKYDETKDQLRVKAYRNSLQNGQETLIYTITTQGFSLQWDMLSVFIPAT